MKKGFTLIELLGVILLISVIATIAVIAVDNSIRKSKIKTCKIQEENIIEAAKTWQIDHPVTNKTIVYIQNKNNPDLTTSGYIEKLKNPITNEEYSSKSYVEINVISGSETDKKGYTYEVKYIDEPSCES